MKGTKEDFGGLTRRDFLYLSGAGIAGLTMGGISELGYGAEKKAKYGGIIKRAGRYVAGGIDPHKNQDAADYFSYVTVYEGLTEQGSLPHVEIYPMLAKSWEISQDGREFIFSLREKVLFHHGKEMDSGDVKYSLDRVMNPVTRAPRAFAFRWVDSIDIIDKYHIKIKLKEPFAPFLASLTCQNCGIIPAGWEPTVVKGAPGTGPFIFKSFVPLEMYEATRFDKFWLRHEATGDRLPYLDGIIQRKIVDESVRWTALRTGDMNFIDAPPRKILADALLKEPVPGIVMNWDAIGGQAIFYNLTKSPFDNKKVRQAIAYAIDKKTNVEAIFWGLGKPSNNQPFPEVSRFYIPVKDREVNLAKAKQLLAEAGYPNGFKTEILTQAVSLLMAGCEAVIGQLREIGIEATMKVVDRAANFTMMRKGDYTIGYGSMSERFDWDDAYYMYFHSNQIGKNNWSRYNNKKMDELVEKGRITWRMEDRRPIYKGVVDILMEDLPVYFICKSVVGYAHADYVKGWRKGFGGRFGWHGGGVKYVWLDK